MIPTYDFFTALKFAAHAAGKKDVRYYLNGVLFDFSEGALQMESTDGHRVAKIRLSNPAGLVKGRYIIKRESVEAVIRAAKTGAKDDSFIEVAPAADGADALQLISGGSVSPLQILDGNFPDIARAVPQTDPTGTPSIGIDAGYLADAARSFKPLTKPGHNSVKLDTWGAGRPLRLRLTPTAAGLTAIQGEAVAYIMPMRG